MPMYFFLYLIIELVAVSWVDFKRKIISNNWSLLHVVFFIGLIFFYPDFYPLKLETFLYPVLFIVVGFLLFMVKIMGGGDSKFLATFYLLIPPKFHDDYTEIILISTILVGSILLFLNLQKNFGEILNDFKAGRVFYIKKYVSQNKFSFAPVILLAWLVWGIKRWNFLS